jgi:prolyl-tRNA editing enzyme YbaK/EbsC (Cys-tRNA(Pro) deacylase)
MYLFKHENCSHASVEGAPKVSGHDPKYFADLRLALEEASAELTGYGRNGVSPFGMLVGLIPASRS